MNISNRIKYITEHSFKIGAFNTLMYLVKRVITPKEKTFSVKVRGLKNRIYLRSKTYDVHIFYQIFIAEELLIPNKNVKNIVDLGANIGLSALYFHKLFPKAEIYSFEPSLENFELLKLNTKSYSNMKIYNNAVFSKSGKHFLVDIGEGHASYRILNKPDFKVICEVDCISMDDLFQLLNIKNISVLKIDIEGSEKSVFLDSDNTSWIGNVDCIMLEIHDDMYPNLRIDINKIFSSNFNHFQSGEYTIYKNKKNE